MKNTILTLSSVHINYGPIVAINGIDLEVYTGEIVAILGSNGAGKTTILQAISGLLTAHGDIKFKGKSITSYKAHQIVKLGIAHAPEGRMVFPDMTTLENLEMGAYLRTDKSAIKRDLKYVFELFPRLWERRKQLAGTLSGGEQQMVAIARALLSNPKLLLLDEPSLGMAPILIESIFKAIQEINSRGTTMILVEQNAHAALKIAHRGYVLANGKIMLQGTGPELLSTPEIQTAYLGK